MGTKNIEKYTDGKWRFVSNNGALSDGGNDSGIETFSAKSVGSMVREVIQNSIDQRVDKTKPVVVEFSLGKCSPSEIPGMNQLSYVFDECLRTLNNQHHPQPLIKEFFSNGKRVMNKTMDVLRISDFNTTGLTGADTGDENDCWYNLIKGRGSSNTKNDLSAGSFGIGKAAPFACSALRTIFYASKCDDVYSYVGVSRLISHWDYEKKYKTIGTGFYSGDKGLNAILKPFGLNGFNRKSNGTDLYIIGFNYVNNIRQAIEQAVVLNFFITIKCGYLAVKIGNEEINTQNIGHYIEKLDDKYNNFKDYYKLLTTKPEQDDDVRVIHLDSNEYGKEIVYKDDKGERPIKDDECTLYLMRGPDLNRKILMTRENGMTLFEQDRMSSIPFTGILRITGKTMNAVFRDMEVPSHDKWAPDHCTVRKSFYENAYSSLRTYLRRKINENFKETTAGRIMAFDMDEFFSEAGEDEGRTKVSVLENTPKTSVSRDKKKSRKKNKKTKIEPVPPSVVTPGPINPPGPKQKKTVFKLAKLGPNQLRVIGFDKESGSYKFIFKAPSTRKFVKLGFAVSAEKGNYGYPVCAAAIDGQSLRHEGNEVFIDNVKKDELKTIEVQFEGIDSPVMLEAEYYEAK